MFSYVDPRLAWTDLQWILAVTDHKLPLIVKGIQCAEDAALAVRHGAKGVYLSNHGGRQLEGAPSSLETLLEIRKYEPWVFEQAEVYLDGGIKRGTDVLKALALGATAVGVGRPCESRRSALVWSVFPRAPELTSLPHANATVMYSLVFGDDGVRKASTILRDELAQNMRLLGATSVAELVPEMVNTAYLEERIVDEKVYRAGNGVGSKVAQETRGLWGRWFGKAKL